MGSDIWTWRYRRNQYIVPGGEVRITNDTNVKEIYITDHLGSVRCVVGASLTIKQFYYDPFGAYISKPALDTTRDGFTSAASDIEEGESSLMQMGVRMYSARIGRFLSVDPLHEIMPSYNPYHYAFNSPLVWKDPSGLAPEKEKNIHSEKLQGQLICIRGLSTDTQPGGEFWVYEKDGRDRFIDFYFSAEYDAGFYQAALWQTNLSMFAMLGMGGSSSSGGGDEGGGPRTQGDKSLGKVGVLSKGQANFAIFNLGIFVSSAKYNKSNIENNYNHHDDQKVMIFNKYKYMTQRPDEDGYITSEEAIWWSIFGKDYVAKYGGSMNLKIDINNIDLSKVTTLDFDNKIGKIKSINLYSPKYFSSLNDAQVYGSITLKYTSDGKVRAFWDTYDTDLHLNGWSWFTESPRNLTTLGLRTLLYLNSIYFGQGGNFNSYQIEIFGTAKIKKGNKTIIYLNPLKD